MDLKELNFIDYQKSYTQTGRSQVFRHKNRLSRNDKCYQAEKDKLLSLKKLKEQLNKKLKSENKLFIKLPF